MRPTLFSFCVLLVLALASCGKETPADPKPAGQGQAATPHGGGSHGAVVSLGQVSLGGERFAVARHGPCVPGKEGAVVVSRIGAGQASGLYVWAEDAAGEQISAPTQGDQTGSDWHFHVTPRADAKAPARIVVRLREGGTDERASVPVYAGASPRRDGIAAPLLDGAGKVAGWLEVKLHDDKGDLELWLAKESAMGEPLDLPLDAVIQATFPGQGKAVELRVRNKTRNEDEDGKANVRADRTNYFIFPGETGADASWLQGADFSSPVTFMVPTAGGSLSVAPFTLIPHAHVHGHDH